jgi:hypothetical protein
VVVAVAEALAVVAAATVEIVAEAAVAAATTVAIANHAGKQPEGSGSQQDC